MWRRLRLNSQRSQSPIRAWRRVIRVSRSAAERDGAAGVFSCAEDGAGVERAAGLVRRVFKEGRGDKRWGRWLTSGEAPRWGGKAALGTDVRARVVRSLDSGDAIWVAGAGELISKSVNRSNSMASAPVQTAQRNAARASSRSARGFSSRDSGGTDGFGGGSVGLMGGP